MSDFSKSLPQDVISGHRPVKTHEARWLHLDKLYEHFLRPNFYDIGGTNANDTPDFWFLYKTEQVSKLYILQLLVTKKTKEPHDPPQDFSIYLCNNNQLDVDKRNNIVRLDASHTNFEFKNCTHSSYQYITTYSFDEMDIELMKDRHVMISINLDSDEMEMKLPMDHLKSVHDFHQLILDPVGADFTIESADDTKFPVHKFLLAARSEVFRAMLKGDTAENTNNFVKIDDVGKEDIACIVEFLYTGFVKDLDNCNFFNLLMIADRYLILGLKELAQYALSRQLTTDNALETLVAADICNCEALKFAAFKFIKTNINCLEGSIFEEIQNVRLLRDLCKYLTLKY